LASAAFWAVFFWPSLGAAFFLEKEYAMSVSLPNGSLVAIASGYAVKKNMTALTNANPAVATLEASHGVLLGDIIEVTSGWSRLTEKIVRAGVITTNNVELEGIDTLLTSIYPAGGGTGSVREVTGWTQLAQILESSTEGGEQQFLTYQFLEADAQKRIPTFKNPSGITFSVADDPTLPGYILASVANDDRLPRGIRITLPSGAFIFYNAYVSLNKTPSLTVNELMAVEVTLSLLNEPVRYAS
jgi:Phage tail tube protein, TTP